MEIYAISTLFNHDHYRLHCHGDPQSPTIRSGAPAHGSEPAGWIHHPDGISSSPIGHSDSGIPSCIPQVEWRCTFLFMARAGISPQGVDRVFNKIPPFPGKNTFE